MIIEMLWQVMTTFASGLDFVVFGPIPTSWERPVTNAINDLGLGFLGALRPIFSEAVWSNLGVLIGACIAVFLYRKVMALVKLVRRWLP